MAATALADLIIRRIRATGPLTIAEFMAEALQHPRLGYYATRDPLGAAGDFITAPEVNQVFGELIGLWCADIWTRMGRPDPVLLVELGPGRGTLMADALRALAVAPDFRRALRLHLVETSPALRALQSKTLAAAAEPTWHESLDQVPTGPLLMIANEFLDALPIQQFERRSSAWHERCVGLAPDGATLAFVLDPAPTSAALCAPRFAGVPDGSVIEIRPDALNLAAHIAKRLATDRGAALFIDYGHAESACGDTLQAVRQHRYHPVLETPGGADLTAHVDFQAFADKARAAGAQACGPVTQADFLRALGVESRAQRLIAKASPETAAAIARGVRRLIGGDEMGTLFKVLALAHPDLPVPAGFPAYAP